MEQQQQTRHLEILMTSLMSRIERRLIVRLLHVMLVAYFVCDAVIGEQSDIPGEQQQLLPLASQQLQENSQL